MKKLFFSLIMLCLIFTGCRKDQEDEPELNAETTSIQTEMHSEVSDSEQTSATTMALTEETTDAETSTSQTSSSADQSTTTTTAEISLDAGNALQQAVMDEEERLAIEAVQQSEELIYYKSPVLDFDRENYANLNIASFGFSEPSSHNGSNVHQYFFEYHPMSGTDILYLQKASEGFSGIAFDADQVKSSTGESLENSERLTYQNDSAYLDLFQTGTCMMYNPEHVAQILGQEFREGWSPSVNSKSSTYLWTLRDAEKHLVIDEMDCYLPDREMIYSLDGEDVSVEEACYFLNDYLKQGIEEGWISSLYTPSLTPVSVELIRYKNGSCGYYFTISLMATETLLPLDYSEKTAYLSSGKSVSGQCIRALMLSKDSVDYLYLPPTLTRTPDYQQTLPGTYCTLAEACEILSEYLDSDHVYDVNHLSLNYETVFISDLGMVQSPMWHFEVTSLIGAEGIQYSVLYADVDLETKELYVSYH